LLSDIEHAEMGVGGLSSSSSISPSIYSPSAPGERTESSDRCLRCLA
jgi:hypothetical protein